MRDTQPANDRQASKIRRVLLSRRLPLAAAALGVLLMLPSLGAGWSIDDHAHRFRLLGHQDLVWESDSPLDVFRFFDGNPERTQAMKDLGVAPWWTVSEVKAAFWRPVTALTHWVDYCLWPNTPALMHAQSLAWFGMLVLVVGLLYRQVMGWTATAGLATLLFALDDAHVLPATWLANRNALLGAIFGMLALLCHDAGRRGRHAYLIVAPLLLGVSLLSCEMGIATTAYLFAYAVVLDTGTKRSRLLSLMPYAMVVLVWRVAWTALGYGTSAGIGFYIDPLTDPLDYLAAIPVRAPILLLSQCFLPPAEVAMALEDASMYKLYVPATMFVLVACWLLLPLLRADRTARFWAIGLGLSLLPACATFPAERLLLFVGVGAGALLARYLVVVFDPDCAGIVRPARRRVSLAVGGTLAFVHLGLMPLTLPIRASAPTGPRAFHDQLHVGTPMDAAVADQDVVILNAPSAFHAIYLPIMRALDDKAVPRHTRILGPGYYGMTVRRPDAHTLVVHPERGFFSWKFDRLFRGSPYPMELGERVELAGLEIEITGLTNDNRPAEATFRFAVPLDDPSLLWLRWRDGVFIPYRPPAIGEQELIPPAKPSLW